MPRFHFSILFKNNVSFKKELIISVFEIVILSDQEKLVPIQMFGSYLSKRAK